MQGIAVVLLVSVTSCFGFDSLRVTFDNNNAGDITDVTFEVEIPKGKKFEVPRWRYLNIKFPDHKFFITHDALFESSNLLGSGKLTREQMWWDRPTQTLRIAGPLFQRGPNGAEVMSGTVQWRIRKVRLPFSCDNPGTYVVSTGDGTAMDDLSITADPSEDIIENCNLAPTWENTPEQVTVTEDTPQSIFDGTSDGSVTLTLGSGLGQNRIESLWEFSGSVSNGKLSVPQAVWDEVGTDHLQEIQMSNSDRTIMFRGSYDGSPSRNAHTRMEEFIRQIEYTPDLDFHHTDNFMYNLRKSFKPTVTRSSRWTAAQGIVVIDITDVTDAPKISPAPPMLLETEWQDNIPLSWNLAHVDTHNNPPDNVHVSLSVKYGKVVFPIVHMTNVTCDNQGDEDEPQEIGCANKEVGDRCNDGDIDTINDECQQFSVDVVCAGVRPVVGFITGGVKDQQIIEVLAADSITPDLIEFGDIESTQLNAYHIIYLAGDEANANAMSDSAYDALHTWVSVHGGRLLITGYGVISDNRMALLAGSQSSIGISRSGRREKSIRQPFAEPYSTRLPFEPTPFTSGRYRICNDAINGDGAISFWSLESPIHQPGNVVVSSYGSGEGSWTYYHYGNGVVGYIANGLKQASPNPDSNPWSGLHGIALRNFATDSNDYKPFDYGASFSGSWDEMAAVLDSAIYQPPVDTCYRLMEDMLSITLTTGRLNSPSATHNMKILVTPIGFEESCGTVRERTRFDFTPNVVPTNEPVTYTFHNLLPWHYNDGDSMKVVVSRTRDCWRHDWVSNMAVSEAPSYFAVLTTVESGRFYICYSRTITYPQWTPSDNWVDVIEGAETVAEYKYTGCRGFINVDDGNCGCDKDGDRNDRYNATHEGRDDSNDFYEHINQYSELRDDVTVAPVSGIQGTQQECESICVNSNLCHGFTFNRKESRCWFSTDDTYNGKYFMMPGNDFVWYEKKQPNPVSYQKISNTFSWHVHDIRGVHGNVNDGDNCEEICDRLINCRSYTVNKGGVGGADVGTCTFSSATQSSGLGDTNYDMYRK